MNWCLLKRSSVKLTKLLVKCLKAPWKSFYHQLTVYRATCIYCLWHSESSSAVMLLLHADWVMLKNTSNNGRANSMTRNPCRRAVRFENCISQKIIWWLGLGFSMDLLLNAMTRSINFSVYLVFDLAVERFKFLGENLLGAGIKNKLSTLDSFS